MINRYSQLGDSETDVIVRNVIDTARGIWPEQTTQAESWINQQLAQYGISYAKYQAERTAMTVYPWLQSPITWAIGAFLLWQLFGKK